MAKKTNAGDALPKGSKVYADGRVITPERAEWFNGYQRRRQQLTLSVVVDLEDKDIVRGVKEASELDGRRSANNWLQHYILPYIVKVANEQLTAKGSKPIKLR